MHIRPVPTRAEGNSLYPLPPDYPDLTPEGQRQARINACRLWLLPARSPSDAGVVYAECVRFFDRYYLHPDPDTGFNPFFYDQPPRRNAPFHYDILKIWGAAEWQAPPDASISDLESFYQASIITCPRGSAKSTLARKSQLLEIISRPGNSIDYVTNSNDNAEDNGIRIKVQCYENERIQNDWAPDPSFGGRIRPPRGERPMGTDFFILTNNSRLRSSSVESRLRGRRSIGLIIDDAEHDARASTSMEDRRANMASVIFDVCLPMIQRPGAWVRWINTFISRQHYAFHAMSVVETPDGPRAADPRFDRWYRLLVRAAHEGPDGRLISCWPDMWPVTEQDRLSDPRLYGCVSLETIRDRVGTASFEAEYMANPGVADGQYFGILTEQRHGYEFTDIDPALATNPTASGARIRYQVSDRTVDRPLPEFLRNVRLFMTVDTSYTERSDSDFKVAHVLAHTPENCLVSLDMWSGRVKQAVFVREILRLADKWRVPILAPEVVRESHSLYNELHAIISTRMTTNLDVGHIPKLVKLNPGVVDKRAKIAALGLWFEHGLVKLPFWRRSEPAYRHLFNQIDGFNPESPDGGLQHDDHIDTLSMALLLMRGKPLPAPNAPVKPTIPELLAKGRIYDEHGNSILRGTNIQDYPADLLIHALEVHTQESGHDNPFGSAASRPGGSPNKPGKSKV